MSDLFGKARQAYLPDLAIGNVSIISDTKAISDICPSCNDHELSLFTRNKLWRYECTGCGAKGDTIDYMVIASGSPLRQAALKIIEMQPNLAGIETAAPKLDRESQRAALLEVGRKLFYLGHTSVKEVIIWVGKFGIKENQIISMALDGRLKMLPADMVEAMARLNSWVGKELLVKSGLWKDGRRCPAIAFRQVVMFSKDRRAIEFLSIEEGAPILMYGELTSPFILSSSDFIEDVMLVNGGVEGLKAIGAGFKGNLWSAPNGNWPGQWFWDYAKEHPAATFDLSRLPETSAADVAAKLSIKGISYK